MDVHRNVNASNCWKRMLKVRTEAETYINWLVGNGQISIHKDKWLPTYFREIPNNISVHELFLPTCVPNDELISEVLGPNVQQNIHKINIRLSDGPDRPICSMCSDGHFAFSTAYNIIQKKYPCVFLFGKIWNKWLPQKIYVFLWKIQHNILSTDAIVMKRGIYMASKCSCCCISPGMESTTHLLRSSEIACTVWKFFSEHMDQNVPYIASLTHILVETS